MWSVGVTAYVLLMGALPFELPEDGDLWEYVTSHSPSFSQPTWQEDMADARDFIMQCMTVDADQRLTASQALNHSWLAPHSIDGSSAKIDTSPTAQQPKLSLGSREELQRLATSIEVAVRATIALPEEERVRAIGRHLLCELDGQVTQAAAPVATKPSSSVVPELQRLASLLTTVLNDTRHQPGWPQRAVAERLAQLEPNPA
jgi:serine/threonine protein kinase